MFKIETEDDKGIWSDVFDAAGKLLTFEKEEDALAALAHHARHLGRRQCDDRKVAVAIDFLFGGVWYLIVGALAGAIAGGLADDRK